MDFFKKTPLLYKKFTTDYIFKFIISLLIIVIGILSTLFLPNYAGKKIYYLCFSFSISGLLFLILLWGKLYFIDLFFILYLWIGYWLKFTLFLFNPVKFKIWSVGNFSFTPDDFDSILLISSLCFITLGFVILMRHKLIQSKYNIHIFNLLSPLKNFTNLTNFWIIVFLIFVILCAILNYHYAFYLRGVPSPQINFLLLGVMKWLLQFGLASFAMLIAYELLKLNKSIFLISFIVLFALLSTNISMLSRGTIVSAFPFFTCLFVTFKYLNLKKVMLISTVSLILFFLSISISNSLRQSMFNHSAQPILDTNNINDTFNSLNRNDINNSSPNLHKLSNEVDKSNISQKRISHIFNNIYFPDLKVHVLDRIVGIEGMMAIWGHGQKGWELFFQAVSEKSNLTGTSFYDTTILKTSYSSTNDKNLFFNLMGIFPFLLYPNSILFLIVCFVIFYLILSFLEFLSWKFGGNNHFFSSLIGHVLAYRLIHFGYAPQQTYLLLITILFNILIFSIVYHNNLFRKFTLYFRR